MKTKDLLIRGYIHQEEDQWVAVCLDYNLVAQADTQKEVEKKIFEQLKSYINEALDEDKEYASQLLTRRAPLSEWLRYYYYKLVYKFHEMKNGNIFVTPIPMRAI